MVHCFGGLCELLEKILTKTMRTRRKCVILTDIGIYGIELQIDSHSYRLSKNVPFESVNYCTKANASL